MGENAKAANGLFNMGYNIYALFLLISTAGIPAAIAKQTARYNSLNEYGTSRRLFIRALQMMGCLRSYFSLFMYIASPWLAHASGGGEEPDSDDAFVQYSSTRLSLYECDSKDISKAIRK